MTTATYLIPECNLAELETRVAKLNRRAKRLGVPAITLTKTPDHVKARVRVLTVNGKINSRVWMDPAKITEANAKWPHEDTGERMAWWSVEVTGETPAYKGWTFTAVLEPLTTEDGETLNFVRALPGETCPAEYRDAVGRCDHCKAFRRRNETFVVRHEGGEHKVVGRQCLKDFLAYHGDPHQMAEWAESLAQLGTLCGEAEDEEWLGGGGRRERAWDLKKFLTVTATRIRLFGWLGRGKAREEGSERPATADSVIDLLTPPHPSAGEKARKEWEDFCSKHPEAPQDAETAEAAIEWAKDLTAADLEGNDYLANVNLVARVGTAGRKTAGVAASILVAHAKVLEREVNRLKREALPPSEWVGEVGERIKMVALTAEKAISHEGFYGLVRIHKLHDAAGNDFTWFASGRDAFAEGETLVVDATVKKHEEFRGRKATVLTRVTIWSEEGLEAHRAKEEKKAERLAKKAAKAAI